MRQVGAVARVLLLSFIIALSSLTTGLEAGQALLQQDQMLLAHADRTSSSGAQTIRHHQEALRNGASTGKFAERNHRHAPDGLVPTVFTLPQPRFETAALGAGPSPVLQAANHAAYSARAPPLPV